MALSLSSPKSLGELECELQDLDTDFRCSRSDEGRAIIRRAYAAKLAEINRRRAGAAY